MSHFHNSLAIVHSIQKFVLLLLGSLVLVIGVNIHYIIELFVTIIDRFNKFINSLINRYSNYYDPVRDRIVPIASAKATNVNSTNVGKSNNTSSGACGSGGDGSDDGDDRRNNSNKEPASNSSTQTIQMSYLLAVLEHICRQIINLRQNTQQTSAEIEWYGSPRVHGYPNPRISLQHIVRYAIAHPNEQVPDLNIPVSSILSSEAIQRIAPNATLRTLFNRVFVGSSLNSALLHNQDVRSLLSEEGVPERQIVQGTFLLLLRVFLNRNSS
jgi:hypothetical protein